MLEPGLEAGDILLDLLDEGQAVGKRGQSLIRCCLMSLDCGRTCGDQRRVERIILGPLTVQPRKGPHLDRLEDQNHKTRRLQVPEHTTFITTGRLPTRSTPAFASSARSCFQPRIEFATCQRGSCPQIATSSLS